VQDADLIAFDFYSRYHRATGAATSSLTSAAHCNVNDVRCMSYISRMLAAESSVRSSWNKQWCLHCSGMPCERFGQQEGAPTCKPNRLRWCHTDLGANAMRWPRLIAENRRFGFLAAQ
jgi:hypothetical protein